jgi:hypothetical protein
MIETVAVGNGLHGDESTERATRHSWASLKGTKEYAGSDAMDNQSIAIGIPASLTLQL